MARAGEVVAGILGPILSTYTTVLLGDTANPIWRGARHLLPFVFSGSSLASSGATHLRRHPGAGGPTRPPDGGGRHRLGAALLLRD